MANSGLNLLEALEHIDPAQLDYQQWTDVGMALKQEGYGPEVWEEWSARDSARFHPGECRKKWGSFAGSGRPVTGGTIVKYAQDQGWKPAGDPGMTLDWDSAIGRDDDSLRVIDSAWVEEQELPAPPEPMDGAKELIRYLNALFEPSENVGYVTESFTNAEGRKVPTRGAYDRTAGQLVEALTKSGGDIGAALGDYDPEAGAWIRFNPLDGKGVKNENVTEYRYALVESDTLNLARQYSLLLELKLPIAVMVHSGGKSIHAIVRIDAKDYGEYRQRVDYLYAVCQKNGMELDRQNRNPSRLSRMPGVTRKGQHQYILAENVGLESFEAWKEYIEGINDNLPDMESMESSMRELPELAPELISGVLRHGHKLLLSGPSKAGKSFALIELCIAIAGGWEWMGRKCDSGRVLYVNLELDRASCLHRFNDVYVRMSRGVDFESIWRRIDIWNLRGKSCPMDQLTPKLIRRAKDRHYSAIIIDPIYKVITGDENSADQMAAFCNQFDKLCAELGCAVIYCHHHSKGSQGQKNSMDRASGSGVFARDPDALLDLIELDIPEKTRTELIQRIKRDEAVGWLRSNNRGLLEQISQDDQCSFPALMAALKEKGEAMLAGFFERITQATERRIERMTAWRMEGVVREFPPIEPYFCWFKYPVHVEDDTGILKDLAAAGEKHGSIYNAQQARKKQAAATKENNVEKYTNAILNAKAGDPVTLQDIADYLKYEYSTVQKYVKRDDNKHFHLDEEGFVRLVESDTDTM